MGVHYAVTAHVPAGTSWVVKIFKRHLEWEAVRPREIAALQCHYPPQYTRMIQRQPLWVTAFGEAGQPSGSQPPAQDMVQTPYGKYSRFLHLSGELVQMASTTENVTFHNLDIRQSAPPPQYGRVPSGYTPLLSHEISTRPQTVVTPSGISLSLLPLSALGSESNQFGGYGSPDSIRMLLRFGQAPPMPSSFQQASLILPKSPLYKKYHKPVTYSLEAQRSYRLEAFFGGFPPQRPRMPVQTVASLRLPFTPPVRTIKNGRVTYQMPASAVPQHLDSLTLRVVQRAELRTIPVSFLVPIGTQAPAQPFRGAPRPFLHR